MNLEHALIEHGAPTLAGLKTGNLFPVSPGEGDLNAELRRLNRMLGARGLRLIPMRRTERQILLYLYRPDRLAADLSAEEAAELLREMGYPCGSPNRCIAGLISRLVAGGAFPHEIGLFLGYPPSDVRCFMRDTRKGVLCTGCWKVYGRREEAERIFEKYRKCTEVYRRVFRRGHTLERLTVACRGRGAA